MTLEELDQALARLKQDIAEIDKNMTTLETDVVYQMARGNTSYQGETRRAVAEMIDAVDQLYAWRKGLADLLEAAQKQRQEMPKWMRAEKIEEIYQLISGNSIDSPQVTAASAPVTHDIFAQAPSGAAKVSVEKVKAKIAEFYKRAYHVLDPLKERVAMLTEIPGRYKEQLLALKAQVDELGKTPPQQLIDLALAVKAAQTSFTSDPLGTTPAKLEQPLRQALEQASNVVSQMVSSRAHIGNGVRDAQRRLERIKEGRVNALRAYQQVAGKGGDSASLVEPPSTRALEASLAVVQKALDETRLSDVDDGLDRWKQEADALEAQISASISSNEQALSRVESLSQRLTEAKSRIKSNRERGLAFDLVVIRFTQAAEAKVACTPVVFEEADRAIAALETRISEMLAGNPPSLSLSDRLDKAAAAAAHVHVEGDQALKELSGSARAYLSKNAASAAENAITNYEDRLATLVSGAAKPAAPTAAAPPAPPGPTAEPAPRSALEQLQDRLSRAQSQAAEEGITSKALEAFSTKASQCFAQGDAGAAQQWVSSYEVKLAGLLKDKRQAKPASTSRPVQESPPPAVPADPLAQLRSELSTAQAAARGANVQSKALESFAGKAEQSLAAGDEASARQWITSYRTKLGELTARS